LIRRTTLASLILPWNNRRDETLPLAERYTFHVLSVDWGRERCAGQVRYRNGRIIVQNGMLLHPRGGHRLQVEDALKFSILLLPAVDTLTLI